GDPLATIPLIVVGGIAVLLCYRSLGHAAFQPHSNLPPVRVGPPLGAPIHDGPAAHTIRAVVVAVDLADNLGDAQGDLSDAVINFLASAYRVLKLHAGDHVHFFLLGSAIDCMHHSTSSSARSSLVRK